MIDQGAYFQREGGRVRTRSSAPDSSASPDDDVTAEALLAHVPSGTSRSTLHPHTDWRGIVCSRLVCRPRI